MKRIFRYLATQKVRLLFQIIIKIIGTCMDLVLPWILAYILDYVVPEGNAKKIIILGLIMMIGVIIGFVGNVIANRMASFIAKHVTTLLRHDLFTKIEELSASQIDKATIPSLISRMTSDTYNVHQMVGMMQRIGIRAPILLIGGILATLSLDYVLTMVLLATLPLIAIVTYFVSKVGIPLFTKVQLAVDDMVRSIRESASGIRIIKALSKQKFEEEKFNQVNLSVNKYELKSGYTMSVLRPLINLFINVGWVLVIIVGAKRANLGYIKSGTVLAFTTYFIIISNAMLSITRIFTIFSRSIASAKRIDYIMNLPNDLVCEALPTTDSIYHIEFRNVNFSYNKVENNLNNINFAIKKGESLGIIGATGSGKTTIIQLLMRLYDVDSGEILINGRNIKSIDKKELASMFGVVLQNDAIFASTVKDNILFGRDISNEDIELAKKTAQASFIDELENQDATYITSKGNNLSGGQRQRLLITRALAKRPDILILDDASSALDYKTDAALRKGIRNNYNDVTSIIVTQRISSIINCDHILVIDDGEEIGYGKHSNLIKSLEVYKEIYHLQMGGAVNEL